MRKKLQKEQEKLNKMTAESTSPNEVLQQSRIVDRLIIEFYKKHPTGGKKIC